MGVRRSEELSINRGEEEADFCLVTMSDANNCGFCDDDKGLCELLRRHSAKANTFTSMPSEQTLHLDPQRV